jgi:hypothetical protein
MSDIYQPDKWQRKYIEQANATYQQKIEQLQADEARARAKLVNATNEVRVSLGAPQNFFYDGEKGIFLQAPDQGPQLAVAEEEVPDDELDAAVPGVGGS